MWISFEYIFRLRPHCPQRELNGRGRRIGAQTPDVQTVHPTVPGPKWYSQGTQYKTTDRCQEKGYSRARPDDVEM